MSAQAHVRRSGLKPVFIDIDPTTYTVSIDDVIMKRSKFAALVVVHMFGHPADMSFLLQAAEGIPLIEDCAQALFSMYKGRAVGFSGTASFFSFRSGKYLSAGEGSAIVCKETALADKIKKAIEALPAWPWHKGLLHCIATYLKSSTASKVGWMTRNCARISAPSQ